MCSPHRQIFSPQRLLLDKLTNLKMGEGLRKEFSQPEVNNQKEQESDIDQLQYRCHTGGCGGKELHFNVFKKTQANVSKFALMSIGLFCAFTEKVPIIILISCRSNQNHQKLHHPMQD